MKSSDRTVTVAEMMATRLLTLRPAQNLHEAAALLIDRGVSGAPVVDGNGRLLGVLSEKDCLGVLTLETQDGLPAHLTVGELMSTPAVTIDEDMPIARAAEMFSSLPFRRLPVLNANGDLVGQLSRRDVLRAMRMMRREGARFRTRRSDVTQTGSMITQVAARRIVGPETNKQFH